MEAIYFIIIICIILFTIVVACMFMPKNKVAKNTKNIEQEQVIENQNQPQKSESGIGNAIRLLGGVVIILGMIVGCMVGGSSSNGGDVVIAFMWVIGSVITGMFIMGFAEIICLLHSINEKLDNR